VVTQRSEQRFGEVHRGDRGSPAPQTGNELQGGSLIAALYNTAMQEPDSPGAGHPLRSVSVVLAGSGGAGVMTAGNMLLEAAAHAGYYALMTRSSGPQIRGGEAAALLRVACHPVECMADRFDVLAAVDWENVQRFTAEIPLAAGSLVIGDPDQGPPPQVFLQSGAAQTELPLKKLAKAVPEGRANMVLLGAVAAMLGLPDEAVARAVEKTLGKRPAALVPSLAAVAAGRGAAAGIGHRFPLAAPPAVQTPRWLLTGNEAAGYGAIKGGVRFVAAYPITPATELLEWMSPALAEVGGTLVQAEDELASINMAIGGSYGGVPSLTATSGPGLSLMVEALGLAVAAEIPLVVVDVMRVGPSTGIPTKSEQGDLNIALHGLHGDAPHLVLAANSVADCLGTTEWAVQLAEALQTPAIVLSDQFLGQARSVVDRPPDRRPGPGRNVAAAESPAYRRYAVTPDGISPMAIPGVAGLAYTADGLEHAERGTPSSQASDHFAQLDKRRRKLESWEYGNEWADVEGDSEADCAVITFGSCTGPVREGLARARQDGVAARLVSLRLLAPLPVTRLLAALEGVRRVLVVEQNHGAQLFKHLRAECDLPGRVTSLHRAGALQFQPGEIHRHLLEWSRS
jgi:2-oxoglutarate ferredoxin oxidoreductase subunit alpha